MNVLIKKLSFSNRNIQMNLLNDIAANIQLASKCDIIELLSIVNKTFDIELLVKLFSVISLYMTYDVNNTKLVITCSTLYEKAQTVLSKELPLKNSVILNFLCLLVNSDEEDCYSRRYILGQYAKNMIRVSGCLATMAQLFLNKMMYPETWRALCQCLAECCRDSQSNQNQCSHLIAFCLDKIRRGDLQVLQLVEVLVNGNKTISDQFQTCGGFNIFTRQMLQHLSCIQVLGALVTSSDNIANALKNTNIPNIISEVLQENGRYTKIGQWCIVILHHIDSKENDKKVRENKTMNITNKNKSSNGDYNEIDGNTTIFYKNVMKEIWNCRNNSRIYNSITNNEIRRNMQEQLLHENYNRTEEMNSHYNIMQNELNNKSTFLSSINNRHRNNNGQVEIAQRVDTGKSHESYSLGFLNKSNVNKKRKALAMKKEMQERSVASNLRNGFLQNSTVNKFFQTINDFTAINTTFNNTAEYSAGIQYENFRPALHSTQKLNYKSRENRRSLHRNESGRISHHNKNIYTSRFSNYSRIKRSISKTSMPEKHSNVLKNKSISTRLLSAINDSCVNIVNKVKDFLIPSAKTESLGDSECNKEAKKFAFSFTNYMNKRDAVLNNNNTYNDARDKANKYHGNNIEDSQCETCNETTMLKSKLESNMYLKETVKKLKIGINMYGCDFKKISKSLWPNEDYMTPSLLYKLYRKLILK